MDKSQKTQEMIEHNKFVRTMIPRHKQSYCEECGKIIDVEWMKEEFKDRIGPLCSPCFNEITKKV